MQNDLNKLIKEALENIDLSSSDAKPQIAMLLKLCDIALKMHKLEALQPIEDGFESYKFNDAEISIVEEYIKDLKNDNKN